MAKRRRNADENDTREEATTYNTVFVDTSLDTHLALMLNPSDTVSDFKKKIALQHSECFPRFGEMIIHSLQVKRQGYFYHLPDSLVVSSAFEGSKRSRFLYVDASISKEDDKEQYSHTPDASEHVGLLHPQNHPQGDKGNVLSDDALTWAIQKVPQTVQASPRNFHGEVSNDMETEVGHIQDDCQKQSSACTKKIFALMSEPIVQNTGESGNAARPEGENSGNNNDNNRCQNLDELLSGSGFTSKKKHEIQQNENVPFESTSNANISLGHINKSSYKIAGIENPSDDASKKVAVDVQIRETDVREEPHRTLSSDTNTLSKPGAKEASESEPAADRSHGLQRVETYRNHPDLSTGKQIVSPLGCARDRTEDLTSLNLSSHEFKGDDVVTGVGSKRRKKKRKMTLLVPRDKATTTEFNHMLHGSVHPGGLHLEALQTDQSKEHIEKLTLNHDDEMMLLERYKHSDQVEQDGTFQESIPSSELLVTSRPVEAVDSSCTKREIRTSKEKASGVPIYSNEEAYFTDIISSAVQNLSPKDHVSDKTEIDRGVMLSEKCKPSDQGEVDGSKEDSIFSQKTAVTNMTGEAVESSGMKKKKKKARKKASGSEMHSLEEETNTTNVVTSEVPNLAPDDHSRDKIESDHEVFLSENCKPSDQGEVVGANKESLISQTLSVTKMPIEAIDSGGTGRRKKKAKKKASQAEMCSLLEETNNSNAIISAVANLAPKVHINDQAENDENILSPGEPDRYYNIEEEKGLSVNHAFELQLSETADRDEAEVTNNESVNFSKLSGANEMAEVGNSSSTKRTKRKAKSATAKIQGSSDIKHDLSTLSGHSLPVEGVVLDRETVDRYEAEVMNNESGNLPKLSGTNEMAEVGNSSSIKRAKRKAKNSPAKIQGSSDIRHDLDTTGGPSLPTQGAVFERQVNNETDKSGTAIIYTESEVADEIEGEKELSLRHGSKVMLSRGSNRLDSSGANVNEKASTFTATTFNNEYGLESGKSTQTWKKRRVKKYATSTNHISALEQTNAAIGVSPVIDSSANDVNVENKKEQSILPCAEDKEASKEELIDSSTSSFRKKGSRSKKLVFPLAESHQAQENIEDVDDNVEEEAKNNQRMDRPALQDQPAEEQANGRQCLQLDHHDRGQENAGNKKKKAKRKPKKGQHCAAEKSTSRPEQQHVGIEELAASNDELSEGDIPDETGKMSGPIKERTHIASVDSGFGPKGNSEGRPEIVSNSEHNVQTDKGDEEGINFRHYFIPGKHEIKVASVDKVKETLHAIEAEKKAEQHVVVSEDALELEESSSAKQNKIMPQVTKDTSKGSENGVGTPMSGDADKGKTLHKSKKTTTADGFRSKGTAPGENDGSSTALGSSFVSKGSKRVLPNSSSTKQQPGFEDYDTGPQKISRKIDGDLVYKSHKEKSLLTTPGAIFRDGSSESSGDENGNVKSDASTRTPSDNSSSSGYSVGESELSQNSRREGSGNEKRKDGGRKNISNSKFSGPKHVSMDMILRSSSRFKKAKLTASQSQEHDIESQPVEFVPDSQGK